MLPGTDGWSSLMSVSSLSAHTLGHGPGLPASRRDQGRVLANGTREEIIVATSSSGPKPQQMLHAPLPCLVAGCRGPWRAQRRCWMERAWARRLHRHIQTRSRASMSAGGRPPREPCVPLGHCGPAWPASPAGEHSVVSPTLEGAGELGERYSLCTV